MNNEYITRKRVIGNTKIEFIKVTDVPGEDGAIPVVTGVTINGEYYRVSQIGMYAQNLLVKIIEHRQFNRTLSNYKKLAKEEGYDLVIKGIRDLRELGSDIATYEMYRELVLDEAKQKFDDLYR
jgi:hypothetical protein